MPEHLITAAGRAAFFLAILTGATRSIAADPGAPPPPVLRHAEIVFMYAADSDVYRAYGATFAAWGGADTPEAVQRHHALGVRCTGSMWCLTAGARRLHDDPKLREAVARDIEGRPIEVPWLFDHVYEGQKTWFGCTNHPDFREHLRGEVRRVMAGRPDGLHIDDHLGVAAPAHYAGGGFCDHCMAAFRDYLRRHATARRLREAGIDDLDGFDYRDLVRRHAATRDQYEQVQHRIPLMELFLRFHREAAAENVRRLHELAEQVAGRPVLLSANAWIGSEMHRTVVPHLTHIVCEVPQHAEAGAADLSTAIDTYRTATRLGRPLAGTASGHDWAYAAAGQRHELVRLWIALAYAHGQRFMVPHRQWCFNEQKGTHWHTFPIEQFAPVYHFIRDHAAHLDDFEAVDDIDVQAPPNVLCTIRRNGPSIVLHTLNLDYDPDRDRMNPQPNVRICLPASAAPRSANARILRYDAPPEDIAVRREGERLCITLPTLRLWTMIALE